MKQLYLCNICKQMGVRSSKAKIFETFFCPKCKKNTTLFLPKEKTKKEEEVKKEEVVVKDERRTNDSHFVSIKDFFVFMLGFIAALLVLKLK